MLCRIHYKKNLYTAFFILNSFAIYTYIAISKNVSNLELAVLIILLNTLWVACFFSVKDSEHIGLWILLSAIFIRILCFFVSPFWEDDYNRYLWDGYVLWSGENPYLTSPNQFFSKPLELPAETLLNKVAYPNHKTVYGAVSEYIFSLLYHIAPSKISGLKTVIIAFDIALLITLYKNLNRKIFILYAFCPTLIHSFSINMHIDIIAIYFAFLACLNKGQKDHNYKSSVFLAIACSIKIFSILLIPILILQKNKHFRLNLSKNTIWKVIDIKWITLFALCYTALELPFLITGGNSIPNIINASSEWAFNNPIYYALHAALGGITARAILFISLLGGLIYIYQKEEEPLILASYIFSVFILTSPTVNAWYLAWPLIFATFNKNLIWPWVAAATIWMSYCTGMNLNLSDYNLYQIPAPIMWAEWLIPFIGIITFQYYKWNRH